MCVCVLGEEKTTSGPGERVTVKMAHPIMAQKKRKIIKAHLHISCPAHLCQSTLLWVWLRL